MLTLKKGFGLHLEAYNNNVRLIVSHNNDEYVCRIEKLKNLKKILELAEGRVFKGRLQLYKDAAFISVIVKREVLGTTDEGSFSKALDALQW